VQFLDVGLAIEHPPRPDHTAGIDSDIDTVTVTVTVTVAVAVEHGDVGAGALPVHLGTGRVGRVDTGCSRHHRARR